MEYPVTSIAEWRTRLSSGAWQPLTFDIGERNAGLTHISSRSVAAADGKTCTHVEFRDADAFLKVFVVMEDDVEHSCCRLTVKLLADRGTPEVIKNISILELPVEDALQPETFLYGIAGGFMELVAPACNEASTKSAGPNMPPAALQPWMRSLRINQTLELDSDRSGRSSNSQVPLWIYGGAEGGFWFGPEWSGCWRARIDRDSSGSRLRITLPTFEFAMRAGETLELPAASFGTYRGDLQRGRNQLRATLLSIFMPKHAGRAPQPQVIFQGYGGLAEYQTEERLYREADRAAEVGCEAFVLDAGWNHPPDARRSWPDHVGAWAPNAERFPGGFDRFAAHVKSRGMKLGLWIEPRAAVDSPMYRQNPELFLLPRPETFASVAKLNVEQGHYAGVSEQQLLAAARWLNENKGLLDLSREEARALFLRQLEQLLSLGADWIWFDFNTDPRITVWDDYEKPDRKGLLELGFYQGLYRVFDTLLQRHPGLWLETCAAGGRTIDLGMLRRSHSVWVCDTGSDDEVIRNLRSGANSLLPAAAVQTGLFLSEEIIAAIPAGSALLGGSHRFLTNFAGAFQFGQGLCFWQPEDLREARRYVEQYKEYRKYLEKDHYCLLPPPATRMCWDAWQFHDPLTESGILLVFRMAGNAAPEQRVTPLGTADIERYHWSTVLGDAAIEVDERGITVAMSAPNAALVHYWKTRNPNRTGDCL